ncbi:type II toxin-antitoxin system VapC family toxin [Brevundimonas aurantiaca]|uniref:type II toxin-antitoxin system VapC family toxin n=1 Tax=Brevundimonas aurantiaca TaxID=74316 RepID=UPI003015D3CE
MALYLDTSVLVSAFVQDEHSEWAAALLIRRADVVVSRWVEAEFSSALGLRVRSGAMKADKRDQIEAEFDGWRLGRDECRLDDLDFVRCRALLRDGLRLRTPDALHLAVVLRRGFDLATLDKELAAAARLKGVEVVSL